MTEPVETEGESLSRDRSGDAPSERMETTSSESLLDRRKARLEEARFVGYFRPDDFAFCRGVTAAAVRGAMFRGSIRKVRKPGVRAWVIPFSEWEREAEPEASFNKTNIVPSPKQFHSPNSHKANCTQHEEKMVKYF